MAERIIRSAAFSTIKRGLVCQTNLKNRGRLFSAEKRSFKLTVAIREDKNKNNRMDD
jgi:hypothetical protein